MSVSFSFMKIVHSKTVVEHNSAHFFCSLHLSRRTNRGGDMTHLMLREEWSNRKRGVLCGPNATTETSPINPLVTIEAWIMFNFNYTVTSKLTRVCKFAITQSPVARAFFFSPPLWPRDQLSRFSTLMRMTSFRFWQSVVSWTLRAMKWRQVRLSC